MDIGLRMTDYWKALRDISCDNEHGNVALINSPNKAYKLDAITKRVCKLLRNGQQLSSCDAYLEKNGVHFFIEFKNQQATQIEKCDIWKKAYDSISFVRTAIDQAITLDSLCGDAILFIVFQDEPKPGYLGIVNKIHDYAKEKSDDPILFGLNSLKGKLYRDIHTITKTEFCNEWLPKIWSGETA